MQLRGYKRYKWINSVTIETRVKAALSRLSNSYESLLIQKPDSKNVDISDEGRSDFPA